MKTKKTKPPLIEGMVHVTRENIKALEKAMKTIIPDDVEYVLTPAKLNELLDNPESWEEKRK